MIGGDRIRVVDPDFGAEGDAVDFEGFQVPLYRSPERGEVTGESVGLDPLRRQELLRQAREDAEDAEPEDSPGDDG